MVDNVLSWAGATAAKSVVDVGCGIGGSTRHIARKFNAAGTGITLSPVQVGIANARTAAAGLPNVTFAVADALHMPFADASFDLVWSLESGEVSPSRACSCAGCGSVCTCVVR
jgi:tocopherol O-methyltransferase